MNKFKQWLTTPPTQETVSELIQHDAKNLGTMPMDYWKITQATQMLILLNDMTI